MTAIAAYRSEARTRRFTFLPKLAAAIALVALADWLFFLQRTGSTLGLFGLVVIAALALVRPRIRRGAAALALGAAAAAAAATADDPSILSACLFWVAVSIAALLPRRAFDDGWQWTKRLVLHWITLPFGPVEDAWRLRAARRRAGTGNLARHLPILWLPLAGTLLFLILFAAANPLIESAFDRIDLLALLSGVSITRLAFWIIAATLLWALLRPRRLRLATPRGAGDFRALPGVTLGSVILSLLAFNLVFALENGLDLAFLWSGAPLPDGVTLAEYAHRGAYPLIATALLAGLFVLVTLRPGSPLAESRAIRRLVYLWIGQNVLLVASTILRTLDYVDAYSLTRLRIAALIWMTLVAVGLLLICWRIARGKSGAWLINANLVAAGLVLGNCAFVDLGAIAARWNVSHAREAGGRGAALDLCYLNRLDASALLPLIDLERRPLPPALRDRVQWTRNLLMDRLGDAQADWHGWTWRGHRRLAAAEARIAERRLPRVHASVRTCDGTPLTPQPER